MDEAKMTKHEILYHLDKYGVSYKKDLMDYLDVTTYCLGMMLIRLRRQSLVVTSMKRAKITERGIGRLKYFNDGNCKAENCSCKE
ncbi:MAG: hypothetical protein Q8K02_00400 [Flavobacterium sp.]|nr:hypothetical protein [Flavobacterium sp.]